MVVGDKLECGAALNRRDKQLRNVSWLPAGISATLPSARTDQDGRVWQLSPPLLRTALMQTAVDRGAVPRIPQPDLEL